MAEAGTLCNNQDVLDEAGDDADSTYAAEAYTNRYIQKAEGFICAQSKYDWVTNYASVSTIGKEALKEAASCLAAVSVVKQSLKSYFSRTEAQTMLNVLYARAREIINLLRDKDYRNFILNGS